MNYFKNILQRIHLHIAALIFKKPSSTATKKLPRQFVTVKAVSAVNTDLNATSVVLDAPFCYKGLLLLMGKLQLQTRCIASHLHVRL